MSEKSNQPSLKLSVNDLVLMKQIIDLASQRGMFKPDEMITVGQTYSKLATFIDYTTQQLQGESK